MKPEFTRIIRYINQQFAIVEITGPLEKDIRRTIVETRFIPGAVKAEFKKTEAH